MNLCQSKGDSLIISDEVSLAPLAWRAGNQGGRKSNRRGFLGGSKRRWAVRRTFKHYCLNAIIAVGYRVNSERATQFRIWATQILKGYICKGLPAIPANDSPEILANITRSLTLHPSPTSATPS